MNYRILTLCTLLWMMPAASTSTQSGAAPHLITIQLDTNSSWFSLKGAAIVTLIVGGGYYIYHQHQKRNQLEQRLARLEAGQQNIGEQIKDLQILARQNDKRSLLHLKLLIRQFGLKSSELEEFGFTEAEINQLLTQTPCTPQTQHTVHETTQTQPSMLQQSCTYIRRWLGY